MATLTSLSVYCGSYEGAKPAYREAASALGALLAANGIRLVFGGGDIGMMGAAADGALAAGGEVIGVIPGHLKEREVGHLGVTTLHVVGTMHERKERMFALSDACAILPGGLGTLDEALEVLTWKQLRLHAKPIVIVDIAEYWQPFLALIEQVIAERFAEAAARELYMVVSSVDEVIPAIRAAPEPHQAEGRRA